MIRAAAGLLGNQTVRFVGLSIGLHMGLLWLADAVAGRTLITTLPARSLLVAMAIQLAWLGPSIHERTGSSLKAAWLAIGVPFALVAAGVLLCTVIEGANISPPMQSALFIPWWFLYFVLALWKVGGNAAARDDGAGETIRPGRALRWSLTILAMPLLAASAIAVFVIQLAYFRTAS